jgi:hypothetical protein
MSVARYYCVSHFYLPVTLVSLRQNFNMTAFKQYQQSIMGLITGLLFMLFLSLTISASLIRACIFQQDNCQSIEIELNTDGGVAGYEMYDYGSADEKMECEAQEKDHLNFLAGSGSAYGCAHNRNIARVFNEITIPPPKQVAG